MENAWPELNRPEYIEKIDGMIEKCSMRGRNVFGPAAGGFNVLNHGDFFLRNMLFRDIDGKICDVQFVSTVKEEERRGARAKGKRTFFLFLLAHISASLLMLNIKNNQSSLGGWESCECS